jgi:hypothetical protein
VRRAKDVRGQRFRRSTVHKTMDPAISFAILSLITGAILIGMALVWTLVGRLPLSPGILYLALGYALGPAGWGVLSPDPIRYSVELERFAEVALLISLFAVGLKLGVPLKDKRWYLPLRLAFPSMALTVLFLALIGMFVLGLPAGAAVLLAAILAPTDPVLASDVQVEGLVRSRSVCASASPRRAASTTAPRFPSFCSALRCSASTTSKRRLALGGGRRAVEHRRGTGARRRARRARRQARRLSAHAAPGSGRHGRIPHAGPDRIAYGVAQLSHASGFLAVFAAGSRCSGSRRRPRAMPRPR